MNNFRNGSYFRVQRSGFTLIELLMVLAILVIAAGLAIPFTLRSFTSHQITKAADLVRAEMNEARLQSMRTGEVYGFFYFPESGNYKTAPFNDEMNRILQDSNRRRDSATSTNFEFGDGLLPSGILFADGETIDDARAESEFQENAVSTDVRPILFYPDGTSQSARLLLKNYEEDFVEIKLRGMTGTSTSAPVYDNVPRTSGR